MIGDRGQVHCPRQPVVADDIDLLVVSHHVDGLADVVPAGPACHCTRSGIYQGTCAEPYGLVSIELVPSDIDPLPSCGAVSNQTALSFQPRWNLRRSTSFSLLFCYVVS